MSDLSFVSKGKRERNPKKYPLIDPDLKSFIGNEIAKKKKKELQKIKKYLINLFTLQNVTTTPNIDDNYALTQGTNDQERTGDFTRVVLARIKGYHVASASAANQTLIRLIVFVWHQDNTSYSPASIDIFGTSSPTIYTGISFDSLLSKKLTILMDHTWGLTMSASTGSPNPTSIIPFSKEWRLNFIAPFTGNGSTGVNHIYSCIYSTQGSSNIPQSAFQLDVRFEDTN